MHRARILSAGTLLGTLALLAGPAGAEILAMMNYETKAAESLRSLKLSAPAGRHEGIAVVDVDPDSAAFGRVLIQIPLPADLVAHHIFYDRTMRKAYITSLGKRVLHTIDMQRFPYRLGQIAVPQCKTGEDVTFSSDNRTWYLTCMDSASVVVGDVATDSVRMTIPIPGTHPHGLAAHAGIDRLLVTSTVRGDLTNPGETISVIEASTGRLLGQHKLSDEPTPSGVAPVEILFVPGSEPPVAYITNMFGGTLWTATWNPASRDFEVAEAFDFASTGDSMPLEMYFNAGRDRLYVSTAKPGRLHVFDLGAGPGSPRLVRSFAAAEGAHHVAFTSDERYAFVQNSLLNLPGMSDGSVTVVDLEAERRVASIETLKDLGLNPNSIVLLPEWNSLAGH